MYLLIAIVLKRHMYLIKRDYGDRWTVWMHNILYISSVGVTINSIEGNFFETWK